MKAPITPAQAWAALAEHYGWAGGKAELSAGFGSINLGYTADQLQAYGKQCSEHSRERALETAQEGWRCECSTDDACRFARERDALRAELGDLPEAQAEMLAEIKQLRAQLADTLK